MKKAMTWLDNEGVDYTFHNYKKDGLPEDLLEQWLTSPGWETLINRRGTTWRKLDQDVRDNIDEASARAIMLDNPSIIKRPLLDIDGERTVGFSPEEYAARFK